MAKRSITECKPSKRADGRWIAQPAIKLTNGTTKRLTIVDRDRNVVKARLAEIQEQQRVLHQN